MFTFKRASADCSVSASHSDVGHIVSSWLTRSITGRSGMLHFHSKIDKLACKRHNNEQNPKSAESVNAAVAESGSACDAASLGFGFSFLLFSVLRGVCLARRSEATPTCIKTSTRLGAKWLTVDEKYGIINSPINKNL